MRIKPMLAAAGMFVTGVALTGCESSHPYYDGPRSYMPPSCGSSSNRPKVW